MNSREASFSAEMLIWWYPWHDSRSGCHFSLARKCHCQVPQLQKLYLAALIASLEAAESTVQSALNSKMANLVPRLHDGNLNVAAILSLTHSGSGFQNCAMQTRDKAIHSSGLEEEEGVGAAGWELALWWSGESGKRPVRPGSRKWSMGHGGGGGEGGLGRARAGEHEPLLSFQGPCLRHLLLHLMTCTLV